MFKDSEIDDVNISEVKKLSIKDILRRSLLENMDIVDPKTEKKLM